MTDPGSTLKAPGTPLYSASSEPILGNSMASSDPLKELEAVHEVGIWLVESENYHKAPLEATLLLEDLRKWVADEVLHRCFSEVPSPRPDSYHLDIQNRQGEYVSPRTFRDVIRPGLRFWVTLIPKLGSSIQEGRAEHSYHGGHLLVLG